MMRAQRGLTLLECLVALAVIAITLASVSKALMQTAQGHARLQMATKAGWVAQNQLAELKTAGSWPGLGTSQGQATQGDVDFLWVQRVERTPNPLFRRVDISVSQAVTPELIETELTGFIARPLE